MVDGRRVRVGVERSGRSGQDGGVNEGIRESESGWCFGPVSRCLLRELGELERLWGLGEVEVCVQRQSWDCGNHRRITVKEPVNFYWNLI